MTNMGSLKALQEWCRIQCEDYNNVSIKDMSTSFRDGLAFCAIIHRYRPELIDFASLSKENVYENNRLAFEVAESQLGIPALLDPEDMVSMRVPDRLSVITYVSQFYNFFNNKSQANPPSMKRPSPVGLNELSQKRPALPLDDKAVVTETGADVKSSALSSTCSVCHRHVHLVQRFLVDGKLFHRNCFRCVECHSTLLPGSYKLLSNSGSLVCTHHIARHALSSQNSRPDLSKKPAIVESARIGRSPGPHSSSSLASKKDRDEDLSCSEKPAEDIVKVPPVTVNEPDSVENTSDNEEKGWSSAPPNPFDESDEEEEEEAVKEDENETPAEHRVNGEVSSAPVSQPESVSRPIPAPRRVSEPTPPPRPAPRVRLPPMASPAAAGEQQKPLIPPKPRERSQSPGSLSGGSQKFKDPPWLALVQSQESKKKKAPPPPVPGLATPPNAGSVCSLKGDDSRSSTPPVPANPFDDDEDEVIEKEEASDGAEMPPTAAASHPWYSIRRTTDSPAADTSPSRGSSSRSVSPATGKSKKRTAPRVPQPPASIQAPSPSQASSCSPSPALSTESLSSGSEQRSGGGGASSDQEQIITKSTSEPSISTPDNMAASSSNDHLTQASLSPSPARVPSYASSAPATPQTTRSTNGPSPLASDTNHKRICKENPFNRKASPSPAKSKSKPPKGPRPARPPAPGHGFPLIKRRVQSDQYIPVEDIYGEMGELEKQLDELEQRGVVLEKQLRDNPNDEDEERLLVDWFKLIHEKHLLVRREAELVYTAKQQNLEERQADVEYELRCLLNKPEKDWTEEDKSRDQELMVELVTIIEQRNQIVNNMDQDKQREEEEDKLMEAMLKKKDFSREPDCDQNKKKGAKGKSIKLFKRLSHKGEHGKSPRPHKEKS